MEHPPEHVFDTALTRMLNIRYPIIMAPMFLVSNETMLIEALKSGITGAIPALNFRTDAAFRKALENIRNAVSGPIGVNLIVNKSNIKLREQLDTCKAFSIDYIITSLGSPEQVIEECKPLGIKVFCDVVDEQYARKVSALGADALIAVNKEAGGHAGKISGIELIKRLKNTTDLPIISAGGVGMGHQMIPLLEAGACGFSIGTVFIASSESPVSEDYKNACIHYGAKDIVMTSKLSGTPCTVINTPYVQQIGTQPSFLEKMLNSNKRLKKWVKALIFLKGMKSLEKAAFSATYKSVWCAGPSVEYVTEIKPVQKIVQDFIHDFHNKSGTTRFQ